MIGAGIGLIVDYGVQVFNNVEQGMPFFEAVYRDNIDWSETAGSTAAGGAGSLVALPISSLGGSGGSLLSRLAWSGTGGMVGGVVGGQAGALTQAAFEEAAATMSLQGVDGRAILEAATEYGLIDPETIATDAATGAVLGMAGEGLKSALNSVNPFKPWQGSAPTVPMVSYEPVVGGTVQTKITLSGNVVVLTQTRYQQLMTAFSQGAIDVASDLLLEWIDAEVDESLP